MDKSSDDTDDFGKALVYSTRAPLAWAEPGQSLSSKFDAENEQCLRVILNLSEHHTAEYTEDIAAIERKVDITMQMVAELLRASIDMPTSKDVCLGAREITWQEDATCPSVGAYLDVAVYLHELYPKPLRLRGRLSSVKNNQCKIDLEPQSEEVQQLLEKFIFLHHRRAIALAKKA